MVLNRGNSNKFDYYVGFNIKSKYKVREVNRVTSQLDASIVGNFHL
jgi:hypothetical protein